MSDSPVFSVAMGGVSGPITPDPAPPLYVPLSHYWRNTT